MFLGTREAEKRLKETQQVSDGMKGGFSLYSCTTRRPSGLSGSTSNDTSLDTRAAAASLLPSETATRKSRLRAAVSHRAWCPHSSSGPHVPSSHPADSPVHDVGGQGG